MFCYEEPLFCRIGELNLSQDFINRLCGIPSVKESLFKVSFVFIKFSLIELVLKKTQCLSFGKTLSVLNGYTEKYTEKSQWA